MKTIIEMAREAGIRDCICDGTRGCLERFAALVRAEAKAEEREACAKVCEARGVQFYSYSEVAGECYGLAAAIRARGNT